jgi:hypothetical protein
MYLESLMPLEIRRPEQPEPMNFAFDRCVSRDDLRFCRTVEERNRLFEGLKRYAAGCLADHIAKHCKWFERSYPMDDGLRLRLELTISDRGAYENWVPVAEARGSARGKEQAIREMVASLPYGLADAAREYYE